MDKHEAKALALMQQAQYHQYQKELEEYKSKLRKARSEKTRWKNRYLRLSMVQPDDSIPVESGQSTVDIEPLINDIKSGKYYHETDNGGYNMEPMEIVNIIVSKIRDYFTHKPV